jgi:hypothetical protein
LGRARDVVVDGQRKEVEGILGGVVPTSRVETLSVRFGDVFGNLVLVAAIGIAGLSVAVAAAGGLRREGTSPEKSGN